MCCLMVRRPPRSTPKPSSGVSDVYKRQTKLRAFVFGVAATPYNNPKTNTKQKVKTKYNNKKIGLKLVYFVFNECERCCQRCQWRCGRALIGAGNGWTGWQRLRTECA
eukprot:TRINITY_DN16840_c0_g1_i1.p3 TRINITY_DN16840_c0_g1~~TRINITY_DN16840_c0_g1_i1.p3  ORF type:complete len:108 (-),score=4.04 TRINITY_DN16840_c0_g1_i1:498-821(-)